MRELPPVRMEKKAPWEGVSAMAGSAGLYEGHEIKAELVIGPEITQPPDVAYALRASKSQLNSAEVNNSEMSTISLKENLKESPSIESCNDQLDKKQDSDQTSQPIHNAEQVNSRVKKNNEEIIYDNPLQCEVCSREFSQKLYLTRHRCTHLVKKLHSCTTCKKEFKEKIDLISHMKTHTMQKSFPCDVCNKQFVTSRNLINHKLMHAGGAVYSCDTCEKKFSHKSYLNTHRRIHKVDKHYSCNDCGKQFSSKYQFSRHRQSHLIEKPYTCKNCKKQFAQSKYFVKHIWICKM